MRIAYTDHSLDARIADLEAVADAAGFPQFALMAMAQGGPVAISYAAHGLNDEELDLEDTLGQMIKVGWARPDSTFRRVFTSLMIPGASEEQMRWLDDLQRVAASSSTAYTARQQRFTANADHLLPALNQPTLVLHSLDDHMNTFAYGRHLASSIVNARLVALESENHILLENEPAWLVFRDEVRKFREPDRIAGGAHRAERTAIDDLLTKRELGVLTLAADGLDNEAISEQLNLSPRTVERHLQNIYAKLGVHGRSARMAAARRLLVSA